MDDDAELEGSLTGSITAKDPAASSLQVTKGPARDLLARGCPRLLIAAVDS
jgi:hypothetical protein